MNTLPSCYQHESAPSNVRYCHRLRVKSAMFSEVLIEFHMTWVGADVRGVYISILGDSALVPWREIIIGDTGQYWVRLQFAHLDLHLPASVYRSTIECMQPLPASEESQPLVPMALSN